MALQLPGGVLVGDEVTRLLDHAKAHNYAIPSFNITSSSVANGCLEAAAKSRSPVMLQLSNGGGAFFAGKGLKLKGQAAAVAGSIAAAHHVHTLAKLYGVPVVLHTDHCSKKLLPWVAGLLDASEEQFRTTGRPLFSSHMLDLSEEPLAENIAICAQYLRRMAPMGMTLEMELGITGGEEDGVDNSGVDQSKLYTQKEDVLAVYDALTPISPRFTIAASFGNVHGVYKPGNVKLQPELLAKFQKYVSEQRTPGNAKPLYLVFHGGSGSEKHEIREALQSGTIKMNVDTDTQWAYWQGIRDFYKAKEGFLQGQIGNPEGADKPNKKFYDPRVWLRKSEEQLVKRVRESMDDLGCAGRLPAAAKL